MTSQAEDDSASRYANWYEAPDRSSMEQGDLLIEFPIVVPVAGADGKYDFVRRTGRVVVLTQSCDIPKPAQRSILVAEVHDYDQLVRSGRFDYLRSTAYKQSLARGSAISDFLLPPSPDDQETWWVVNFRQIALVPTELARAEVDRGRLLRLRSPYREYLSQAFGRFIMRVGLPDSLSEFEKYKPRQ